MRGHGGGLGRGLGRGRTRGRGRSGFPPRQGGAGYADGVNRTGRFHHTYMLGDDG